MLSGTIGDMTWDGTAHLGNKLKFTNLDVTGGSIDNVNISTLTIPDNSLAITKISNLNSCLNSLSTNKQDDRPLTARTYISITESPSNNWTITAIAPGAEYSNKDNNIVINNADGTINLSTTIPTNNISFDIITASTGYITSGNVSGIILGYSLLESSYNHYAIGHVTNGRTFIISYGQILTFRKTDLTTNNGKTTRTIGEMTFDGTALQGDTLNFSNLSSTNGSISNLNILTLTIPEFSHNK